MPRTNIYDGHSGSSASARVSRAVGVTLKRNLFQIVRFLSFILTCGYGMINMVVCVVFPSRWMTRSFAGSKHITQGTVTQVLRTENEAPKGIHRRLLTFCDQDTEDISTSRRWVRKSRDSGGNVELNDQPRSGRPATTVHNVKGQTADELIFIKLKNLSESHSGKAEDWFCPCQ